MTFELILFFILAVVAIAAAVGMLLARNPVYSAIYLILNFSAIAVFYLLLQAPFIAMAQITVYAGAIMVLFLFVIMLIGGEQLRKPETLGWQTPVAVGLGVVLLVELVLVLFYRQGALSVTFGAPAVASVPLDFGSPETIGLALFQQYLLPFEVVSILLLVAMIGAITLTRLDKKAKKVVRRKV